MNVSIGSKLKLLLIKPTINGAAIEISQMSIHHLVVKNITTLIVAAWLQIVLLHFIINFIFLKIVKSIIMEFATSSQREKSTKKLYMS